MALNNKQKLIISQTLNRLHSLESILGTAENAILREAIDMLTQLDSNSNEVQLTDHFKLSEFLVSATATLRGITLCPNSYVISNLISLCRTTLEPARTQLDGPVFISSGYRNEQLNRAVGGSIRSYHLQGRAADIHCFDNEKLYNILLNLPHSELIKHPSYIHVAL
ncbi:peptidase [Dipodfec virus UOA04_Rod_462]|nr:peptidase [Dipodfec virus UOA04_Rod_462]